VTKPFSLAELVLVIRKELDSHRLREENRSLREALGRPLRLRQHRGAERQNAGGCWRLVERVAPTNSTVLLGGESGVGKRPDARAIHEHSSALPAPSSKS